MKVACYSCLNEAHFESRLGFREECLNCRNDLHVCKNCQFHDLKAYNECTENSADVVREKDRANLCEYFTPRKKIDFAQDEKAKNKSAAEALFKKT